MGSVRLQQLNPVQKQCNKNRANWKVTRLDLEAANNDLLVRAINVEPNVFLKVPLETSVSLNVPNY